MMNIAEIERGIAAFVRCGGRWAPRYKARKPAPLPVRSLLTWSSAKIDKGKDLAVAAMFYGAPHTSAGLGINVCPGATPACIAACLTRSGRLGMETDRVSVIDGETARIKRTRLLFQDPYSFGWYLARDVRQLRTVAAAEGLPAALRMNATTDLDWSLIIDALARRGLPIRSYGYTKVRERVLRGSGETYSYPGAPGAHHERAWARLAVPVLDSGGTVAVVFKDKADVKRAMTDGYLGYPVVDGDAHDLRYLDPPGHVVALSFKRPKGKGWRADLAAAIQAGFVRDHAADHADHAMAAK